MAKINHHNFVDTINDILAEAKKRGVLQLEFEGNEWKGDTVKIANRDYINFGTCGYMGLETHPKVLEATRNYTDRFGVQFSVSRTYLVSKENYQLEQYLSDIFEYQPTISFTSTTMAHLSILPIVVGHRDAIILDQQAHISIQTAAQLMTSKGVPIDIIRHSNLEMLEHKLKAIYEKYDKIWYMIDGVYSMYGDVAPIDEINELMAKYDKLYLYVDDAHGMSWSGNYGCGRLFKKTTINKKTMYVTTMAKGFGAMGGIGVFPSKAWYDKLILHGGPLAYSHPLPPPMMGAAIGSAQLHLSPEIHEIQNQLREKLEYANSLFSSSHIPVLSSPDTPIFFVGTGQPNVGYNLNKRIIDEGYYVNIGMFPAVPVKNTGLRFTITNHNTKQQIKDFIDAIIYHHPRALEEEGKTLHNVRKAFRMSTAQESSSEVNSSNELEVTYTNTILDIDKELWNNLYTDIGNYDWGALNSLEESFSGNSLDEENWSFYYFIIKDTSGKVVLATFLTGGIFKDDLVSPPEISAQIEKKRETSPYYLCSKTLMMGSLITEGDHLIIDRENKHWKEATMLLADHLFDIQTKEKFNSVILRDFNSDDCEIADIFHQKGFFKLQMPNSNIIFNLQQSLGQEYVELLSPKGRRNVRNEIIKHKINYTVTTNNTLTSSEIEKLHDLYKNVANKNLSLNIFKYPRKLFDQMNTNPNWEFLILKNKTKKVVSIICCYKGRKAYFPAIIGIDYEAEQKSSVYRQLLYQTVVYARNNGYEQLHFGISADVEKKKLGSRQIPKVAFMNVIDQYNMESIDNMSFKPL